VILFYKKSGKSNAAMSAEKKLSTRRQQQDGALHYAGQMNQVFMNLLSNAIEALEEHWDQLLGNAEIVITTVDLGNGSVRIMFTDNGPGISEEIRSRLFDPFFNQHLLLA
jgi:signal transduction histidine kinase